VKGKRASSSNAAPSGYGTPLGGDPLRIGKFRCIQTTALAILVTGPLRDGKNGQLWVPKSVLHAKNRVRKVGDEASLVVKTWWFEKNQENL
jgi:hypothetical protein